MTPKFLTSATLLATVAALAFASPSQAQTGIEAENLISRMPEGYHVVFSDTANRDTTVEMVPVDQTREDWTHLLKINILRRTPQSAAQFGQAIRTGWDRACPLSNHTSIGLGRENGYEFTVDMLMCAAHPETGAATSVLFKAVRGDDALYVVQKSFRGDVEVDEMLEWTRYMRGVNVCDTRTPDHPCPADW